MLFYEASTTTTDIRKLRLLFGMILNYGYPTSPGQLWEKHKYNLSIDILYKENYIDEPVIIKDEKIFYRRLYSYIIGCCKILNIDINTLENSSFDIPPDLKDFKSIPRDDQPYYWIYNRPLFSDEETEEYRECDCNGGESDDDETSHTDCECGTTSSEQ